MVGEAELFQELFTEAGELFVVFVAVFRVGEVDHFHLVELVQAEESAGILTVGASFAAEAGGVGADTLREFGFRNHFTGVKVGQRNFCSRDKEQVIVLVAAVHVFFELRELARAAHGIAGHEVRRREFFEAVLHVFVQKELDEGAFQAGTETAVDRETTTGNLRATFKVKNAEAFAQSLVVHAGEVVVLGVVVKRNRAVLLDHVVRTVLAFRGARGDVRHVHEHFGLLVVEVLEFLVKFVDLVAEGAHGCYGLVGVLALLLEVANLLGFGVAFALEAFHFGEERAAFVVDGEHVLQAHCGVLLFGFSNVVFRIFADFLDVKHVMPRLGNFYAKNLANILSSQFQNR